MGRYVLGIDQSTQGTKALLFDAEGCLICRTDLPHKQYVDERGWVEHDLNEIYANTIQVVKNLVEKAGIDKSDHHNRCRRRTLDNGCDTQAG